MTDLYESNNISNSNRSSDAFLCPCCGAMSKLWHIINGFDILRCTLCKTGFIRSKDIPSDMSSLYNQDYFDQGGRSGTYQGYLSEQGNIIATSRKLLKRMETFIEKGSLVEVGCAAGFFLHSAQNLGWKTKGFEISSYASSIANDLFDLDVTCCDFLSDNMNMFEESADALVALDVIEHLRNPVKFLEKSASILRKDGLLLISTGDFGSLPAKIFGKRWRLLHPPEHIFYFTRDGLKRILNRSGFDILDIKYLWKRYSLCSIALELGCGSLGILGNLAVPFNGFDVMYIFARRR